MKAIVSVIGTDKKGIIAKVSNCLYELQINIEDISQTIMSSQYFTMIMMVNLEESPHNIMQVNEALQKLANELAVEIRIQNEDIFNAMR